MNSNSTQSVTFLLEPVGRNTAPALTLAAVATSDKGHDPVLVVTPDYIASPTQEAWTDKTQDKTFVRPHKTLFTNPPSESVDYAVIEQRPESAFSIQVVQLDPAWNDPGASDAIWNAQIKDEHGNAQVGDALTTDFHNSLVQATQREEHNLHSKVLRPCGWYGSIEEGGCFKVKRIEVKLETSLSLQKHHNRTEHWIVVKWAAKNTNGDKVLTLSENQSTYIPLGEVNRLITPSTIPLEIIEVRSGSYLGGGRHRAV